MSRWFVGVFAVGLLACGRSARERSSTGTPSTGASGSATGGAAGGGAAGTAGAVSAGTGGSGAGTSGAGGAAATGGMGGAAIDPETTRRYTWSECGRIPPDETRNGPLLSLDMDAAGATLVTNHLRVTVWRVADPFDRSEPLWTGGAEGAINTDVSEDGTMVVISGDVRMAYDATTGERLAMPNPPFPERDLEELCLFTQYRFSPDGRFVAGKHYTTIVEVYETPDFSLVAELETTGCGQGLVFLDDSLVTPEGTFRTSDWMSTTPLHPVAATAGFPPECTIYLEPRHATPTACCGANGADDCTTSVANLSLPGAMHPRFSPEGHWVVAGGTLAHTPSGDVRVLDGLASEGTFAPDGDVIVGERDGSLVRFCRSE